MYVITTEKYFINRDYEMHFLERTAMCYFFTLQVAWLIPGIG